MMMDQQTNNSTNERRNFLKLSSFAALALSLPKNSKAVLKKFATTPFITNSSPIQQVSVLATSSLNFNGDNIDRPHDILWNLDGHIAKKGGIPAPSEKRDVVIVGGGMSGLIAGYYTREKNPLILEQDPHFGGNSNGEMMKDAAYSIGAAYITIPDPDSDIENFLKETKIWDELKLEASEDTEYNFRDQLIKDFWKGATDPTNADQFIAVDSELRRIYNDAYPEIPWTPDSQLTKAEFDKLDSISFDQWLKNKFGKVHPHILEYFQLYCWSSFNGSIDELSAAQALNFIASEVDGVYALPGGNAAITQRLYELIQNQTEKNSLRAGAFVLRVEKKSNGLVWVTYEDAQGKVITIETKKCIVASPKYVAKHICPQLPEAQKKAMDWLNFRGYIVANALYSSPIKSPGFDVYCLEGSMPETPSAMKPAKRAFSDVCFGTWAADDKTQMGVVTIYKACPYEGARQFLFNPMAHDKHKKTITEELNEFAKTTGLDQSKFLGMRMTRWGHSIPVAHTNLVASGKLEMMNQSIDDVIFFANQDNWANPAFECSFAVAKEVAELL